MDLSINDIENQQKIILQNLQQLSDNPGLTQLLDKTGYNVPARKSTPGCPREHMSQAVMPANCSSFVMSSNVNSLANAIGQKLPGSVNIGHPSSNSHVLNNSANSNASNGSHAYIGSSSNIGGGSTKQVDLQKLNTHKAEYRQPKSNGGRSHEDSAQSSVPNKGSKYTKDLMMSDNLQQLPAIKDQIEDIFNQ